MKLKIRANKNIKNKSIPYYFLVAIIVLAIGYVTELTAANKSTLQKMIWCIFAIIGLIALLYNSNSQKIKKYISFIGSFALPFFFAAAYTVIYYLMNTDLYGVMSQSISTTLYIVVDILMILAMYKIFKEKAFSITCWVTIISYCITMIIGLKTAGFQGMYTDFKMGTDFYFERHDIGVAIVPLLLVYAYCVIGKGYKLTAGDYVKIIGMLLVMVLCGKRSAYLSIGVGIILILISKIVKKQKRIIWFIFSLIAFIVCFAYVYSIRSGLLDFILNTKGTLADRYYVWKSFDSIYQFSLTYFGKGYQYVHRYMASGTITGMVADYGYLHNSILQIFIETGFFGFTIWFYIYFFQIPTMAYKYFGKDTYVFTVISMIAMAAMFTVDNTLTYPVYQICLMSSLYYVSTLETSEKKLQQEDSIKNNSSI